jgi:hypothetical protein
MNDDIRRVLTVLRNSPDLDDSEVYRQLVADGVEGQAASRLVLFLPMIYCRLLLAGSGARFSDTFRSRLSDGTLSLEGRLIDEQSWNEAMEFAQAEIASGVSGTDLLVVAGRSAEFDAANQLLNHGSKLEDLRFVAPTIRWPGLDPN